MSRLAHAFSGRLFLLALTMWCILTILFALFRLLPGDPAAIFVDNNMSIEMIEHQKQLWGLNDPWWVQYVRYIANMALFRFGDSFFQNQMVAAILLEKITNTCAMIFPALVISVVLGTIIGAFAGWRRGGRLEQATVTTALILHSAPSFFVGILVLMVFSYQLRWLPPGGMTSPGGPEGFWDLITSADYLRHLILPCMVLVSREITGPVLLVRSSMLEIKGADFIDILRAKGLPEWRI